MKIERRPLLQVVQLLTAGLLILVAAGYIPRETWSNGDVVVALAGISVWLALLALAATWNGASRGMGHIAILANAAIALLGAVCAIGLIAAGNPGAQWAAAIVGVWVLPASIGVASAWPRHATIVHRSA